MQQSFQPKEIIFREETMGDAAYVIHSGQVEILKHAEHGEIQLAVLEAGDVFGEMALFEAKSLRSASARALTPVVVEVITGEAFARMLQHVPPTMNKIMNAVLFRLRDTNQRLAAKERATVVLDGGIEQIIIAPADDALDFQPITILAANLPFSIGGYPKAEQPTQDNNLELPSNGPPLMISQKHMMIERKDGEVFVVDVGSRFCSIVNGKVIGRGKVDSRAQLQLGENKVKLGDYTSPYKLILTCQ